MNPSKREEEEEEEEERDKMTTVGGGQQFVRVDFTNIRPKEKKESFVDERFHGCLSSTTTTPRLNQENDDEEEERNQITCRRCAATAATSSSSVTENKEVHELKAIVLKNVLSSEECRELIECI